MDPPYRTTTLRPEPAPRLAPHRRRRWAIALGLLALAGAGLLAYRSRADAFGRADARIERRLAAISLPEAPSGSRAPPAVRVTVTARSVDVDHTALAASWSPARRACAAAALDEAWADALPIAWEAVVPLTGATVPAGAAVGDGERRVLPRLRERLDQLTDVHARLAASCDEPAPAPEVGAAPNRGSVVRVHIDRAVPTHTLEAVLRTLAQAGYTDWRFAVKTPEGIRFLRASPEAPDPSPPSERFEPLVRIGHAGFTVTLADAVLVPGCTSVGAPAVTVPRSTTAGGVRRHDLAALSRCAAAMRRT